MWKRIRSAMKGFTHGSDPDFDITKIWDNSHVHLRPLRVHLDLPDDSEAPCHQCGNVSTVRVVADLCYGDGFWIEGVHIIHCGTCDRFFIPQREHTRLKAMARDESGAAADFSRTDKVTAVNARLWSRSPVVLNIEPTTRCNFHCWYCIGRTMEPMDLSLDNFRKTLDHFPSMEIAAIVGEGEPFLNRDFFAMAALAHKRGIRVFTLSNGSQFSEENVEKIYETGINYIGISIDSVDPGRFRETRRGGDLQTVLDGIERMVRCRESRGSKYPVLGLHGTLLHPSSEELLSIAERTRRAGVDYLSVFQPLNPKKSYMKIYPDEKKTLAEDFFKVRTCIDLSLKRVAKILPPISEFALREGIQAGNFGHANSLRVNCDEEWIFSLASGDITPCCHIKDVQDPEWNLLHNSIDSILNNKRYEQIRFNLWNGIFPSQCEGCAKTVQYSQ